MFMKNLYIVKEEFVNARLDRWFKQNVDRIPQSFIEKLIRKIGNRKCSGIIIETEAYRASDDPASHAGIRKTKRNRIMFEQIGRAYVYFTYGMYHCLNVVARNKKFNAGAVLIRGIYPQLGIDIMSKLRNNTKIQNLTNGPGKLTQALDITLQENGDDLTKYSSLYITNGIKIKKVDVLLSTSPQLLCGIDHMPLGVLQKVHMSIQVVDV